MTILLNEVFLTMAVIPDSMPWRLYIDMDEGDSKRGKEDFGLRLVLEYGAARHDLMDSDSIRDGEFYETVELKDVKELFESIIHAACERVTDSVCKCLPLCHIADDQVAQYREHWREKYKLSAK